MRALAAVIERLQRRVNVMIGRAVLTAIDDARRIQEVQLVALKGEVLDPVERFQEYGFSSHPIPGATAVLLSLGGERQHAIAVAVDDRRHRPTGLAAGEVCLYTDEDTPTSPARIIFKRGRRLELRMGRSSIVMTDTDILLDSPHVGLND